MHVIHAIYQAAQAHDLHASPPSPARGNRSAGATDEDALADVKSAIEFHIGTFGTEVFESETPVLEAFIAEAGIAV